MTGTKPGLAAVKAVESVPAFPLDGSVATLGWGVIAWCESHLLQPDGDNAGEPFRFTREQMNFVLWWYALDARGRFAFRRGVLRRSKGWGKSPFLGALALAELCGPTRFGGWDAATGEPIGIRVAMPWVVIAGVSETQTENTMSAIRAMSEDSDLPEVYGVDVGMTRLLLPGGGKLQPITASSSSQEGARPTFAIMDETHWWTKSNGGHALAKVVRRNLAKGGQAARAIETTNAHEPGMETVAERSYLAHLAAKEGRTKADDVLYDSREAPLDVDLADEDSLRAGLLAAYGDAYWIDLDRIVAEVYDPDTSPEEARRFYLNQIVAAADSWLSPPEWAKNRVEGLAPLALGETITLGFDGSLTDDSTALVAVRLDDGAPFLLGVWEKPEGPDGKGWEVNKEAVRGLVDHVFSTYDVVAFFSDVAYWETDIDAWRAEYGERLLVKATTKHAIGWDMRSHQMETVRAVETLHRAFTDGEVPWTAHDLDDGRNAAEIMKRHVLNARRRPNRWGVSFGKETRESTNKVDILAALVLARMARSRVQADGVLGKRRKKTGRLVGF